MRAFIQPQHPNEYGAIEKLNKIYLENIKDKPLVIYTGGKKQDTYTKISAPKLRVVHMLLFFIGVWTIWGIIYRRKLTKTLRKNKVKTVIVNHSASVFLLSKRMKREFNFIFSQHTAIKYYLFKDIPFLGPIFAFFQRPIKKIRGFAGYNLFTNQDKKTFIEIIGIDPTKVNVIPNFLDPAKEKPKVFDKKKKGIVYFGRFDIDKNIDKTLEFAEKNNEIIDMYGSGRQSIIKAVKKSRNASFKGFTRVPADRINNEYKFNILISDPNLEGYSLATLEAMQVGTIPIVNKRGQLYPLAQELVDKKLAIPYDEYDKKADYSKMSLECIKFIKENNSVKRHIKLIDSVFSKYQ